METETPTKYKTRVIVPYAFIISLTVFLFGFETVIFNPCQDAIASTLGWGSDNKLLMIAIMSALVPFGSLFGALLSIFFGNRYGRRYMIISFGFMRTAACVINVIPYTYTFAIGRFFAGVSIGISQIYVPLYLAEIAPLQIRGKITLLFGIVLTMGQLSALALGVPLGFGVNPYYWILLFILPGVVQMLQAAALLRIFVHESAPWLVSYGRLDDAKKAIEQIYEPESHDKAFAQLFVTTDEELSGFLQKSESFVQETSFTEVLCSRRYRRSRLLAAFIQVFNILNGITSIFYYSNLLFQQENQSPGMAQVQSVALGLWNVMCTLISIPFIDRIGRRPLLIVGCAGMFVTETILGYLVYTETNFTVQLVFLMAFILSFDIGIGPVGWVVTSEILEQNGMIFANIVWQACLIFLTAVFPFAIEPYALGIDGTFWAFAGISLWSFFFVYFFIPETKGVKKQDLLQRIQSKS